MGGSLQGPWLQGWGLAWGWPPWHGPWGFMSLAGRSWKPSQGSEGGDGGCWFLKGVLLGTGMVPPGCFCSFVLSSSPWG